MNFSILFANLRNKIAGYVFKDEPLASLKFSLCFLFGLVPFRLLGIMQINIYFRLIAGLFFMLLIFYKSRFLIPYVLNTKTFQLYFYLCLKLDEAIKALPYPFFRIGIIFIILSFVATAILLNVLPVFWGVFIVFNFSFYRSLKIHFGKISNRHCFVSFKRNLSRPYVIWNDFIENFSNVSNIYFSISIIDKLGLFAQKTKFKFFNRNIINDDFN